MASSQYFKAATQAELQAAFYTQNSDGSYSPNAGTNVIMAQAQIANPPIAQTGDGVSWYAQVLSSSVLAAPNGISEVTAAEALPVTGIIYG